MAEIESLAEANKLKDEGNKFLQIARFNQAAEKYSGAIDIIPTAIYYSNRAQALIKMECYGLAISDANEALKLDPGYIKAYYRRGSANYALGKLKAALKDFKAVVKIAPKDPDATKKMKACERAIREDAFTKAIEADEGQQQVEIDIDAIVVDESYTGPRLPESISEDGESSPGKESAGSSSGKAPLVTNEFVLDLMEYFKAQKLLHRKYVIQILLEAVNHFSKAPSLLRLSLPCETEATGVTTITGTVTVCGDTHGQYYDLCNIFQIGGMPSANNIYLFNGDFVDRGSFSFETVMLLICLKLADPSQLYMLRGNHETKNMNKIYGFLGEIKHKYDDTVMNLFTKVFNWLPLAACIHKKVFVVHGGLSTQEGGVTLSNIENVPRNREPPESGLMSDLLWSDPQPQMGRAPSKRGLGFSFGPDYTAAFLKQNDLQLVIRSHEVKDEGYVEDHNGQCITIFSAPNYCDQMGNKGAFIRFVDEDMKPNFTQFEAVPHPDVPPMTYAGNMFSL
jgi:serine/threonine-protein phosphatase 5